MAMTRAAIVVFVLATVGCGSDECPAARKAASDEVEYARYPTRLERDQLAGELREAKLAANFEPRAADLDAHLRLFEQSMDCLVRPADCCARLAKLTIHERTTIQLITSKVGHTPDLPAPMVEVMKPLADHTSNIDAIGTGAEDLRVITPWCVKARDLLAQIRRDAPAAWKRATDEANTKVGEAKAKLAASDARLLALKEWAEAVRTSKPVATNEAVGLSHARETVDAYQKACH